MSFPSLPSGERGSTKKPISDRKEKIKPTGSSATKHIDHDIEKSADEPQPKKIVLDDQRALAVFRVLFHIPQAEAQPGEISWVDFRHAMKSVGFSIRKQYGGSAWSFTPHWEDNARSIVFHEPHPKKKIPWQIAKKHGRRLTRAYGWTGDTFVSE
ncbi:hypothetical protein MGN70_010927 [Eutypa lata]|nr:hypothetical protein MGN70_010927 [Eutypa lata]